MRIAVVGPSRHPVVEPFAGGQESATAALVTGLRERGHTVRLYAARGTSPGLADEVVEHEALPELSAVAAIDPHLPEPDFLRDHQAYSGVMGHLLASDPVDIVHNHSLHHLPLTLAPAVLRVVGAPTVTTLHTPPFPWMELGAHLAGERARFVAVSGALARCWTTLAPAALTVIPNGVDPRRFPLGEGGTSAVWVGRVTPEKGLDLAVRAARSAGVGLRIVGPIHDREYWERDVQPLLKGADVEVLGPLDHVRSAEIIGSSAVSLVTPRWDEPYGLVAAEAMMCGTPVAGLARGGLPEVVGGAGGLLVGGPDVPEDEAVTALAEAIRTLTGPQAPDRRLVRDAAVTRCGIEAMLDAHEDLYEETTS